MSSDSDSSSGSEAEDVPMTIPTSDAAIGPVTVPDSILAPGPVSAPAVVSSGTAPTAAIEPKPAESSVVVASTPSSSTTIGGSVHIPTAAEVAKALPSKKKSKKDKKDKKKHGHHSSGKKKDKNAPTHPRSAYILFTKDKNSAMQKLHAGAKQKEILGFIAAEWRGLQPEEKKLYEEKAAKDKSRYECEMKVYDKKIERKRKHKSSSSESESSSSDAKEPPIKTARVLSGYQLFSGKYRDEVKEAMLASKEKGENKEIMKKLAVMWKGIPDEEKQKWVERAKLEMRPCKISTRVKKHKKAPKKKQHHHKKSSSSSSSSE